MSVIDAYLETLGEPQKTDLRNLRAIIKTVAPEAEEVISYGMPGFKYKQKYLAGFYAYKEHMSLFPTPGPIEATKNELKEFTLSKGTVQFTHEHQIPASTIKVLIRRRMAEIDK